MNVPSLPGLGAPPLAWRYDPWRERPGHAAIALAAAVVGCLLVTGARPGFLVAVGLCVFVVASFAPAFLPVTCRADDEGVSVLGPLGARRRGWRELRRLEALPSAALLSPYARRHVLDAQRAIVLPLPAAMREAVLARLQGEMRRHGLV